MNLTLRQAMQECYAKNTSEYALADSPPKRKKEKDATEWRSCPPDKCLIMLTNDIVAVIPFH